MDCVVCYGEIRSALSLMLSCVLFVSGNNCFKMLHILYDFIVDTVYCAFKFLKCVGVCYITVII